MGELAQQHISADSQLQTASLLRGHERNQANYSAGVQVAKAAKAKDRVQGLWTGGQQMDKSILHLPSQDIRAALFLRLKRILKEEVHPQGDRLHPGRLLTQEDSELK